VAQSFFVTNATPKKRTWAGYACPVCRFVFRVPKDHMGAGVICPACHYLLNIPQKQTPETSVAQEATRKNPLAIQPRGKKESKPIVARPFGVANSQPAKAAHETTSSAEADTPIQTRKPTHRSKPTDTNNSSRKRYKKQRSTESEPSWDTRASSTNTGDGGGMPWIIGGSLLGLVVVGVGAWLVLGTQPPSKNAEQSKTSRKLSTWDNFKASNPDIELTEEDKKLQQEIQESVNSGMNVLQESEKVVRAFLTAKSAEDLEGLVRTPEVTVPRMKKWYTKHEWSPPGAKVVGYGGGVTVKGVMASMSVRVDDYTIKHIAVERTPKGYLVDWESWVAWAEMDWEDLFKKKPTELVEVRVICSKDSYYNRLFSDDKKWLAVKMTHTEADRSIYGYIESQTSTLTTLMGDLKSGRPVPVTIKIRYPKGSIADNQVIIEEYVQNGWVRQPKDSPKPVPSKEAFPSINE